MTTFDMSLKKKPPVKMQVLRGKGVSRDKIVSVLALKPTITKRTNLLPEDIREKSFFINMIEDFLLSNGYTVITNDFLINVRNDLSPRLDPDKLRNSEYAMLVDSRYVDALIKINSLTISMDDMTFVVEKDKARLLQGREEFFQKIQLFEQRGYEAGDEYCIRQIPYYQFEWSVELIHIKTGRILAKGYQSANSLNHLPKDYKATFALGDVPSCLMIKENYNVKAYTSTEILKRNLVKYMNQALIKLFKDFPLSKNRGLVAVKSYDDINRVKGLKKKRYSRKRVKKPARVKASPPPAPKIQEPVRQVRTPEPAKEEAAPLPEQKVVESPEPQEPKEVTSTRPAVEPPIEEPSREASDAPMTDEEKLIRALKKW